MPNTTVFQAGFLTDILIAVDADDDISRESDYPKRGWSVRGSSNFDRRPLTLWLLRKSCETAATEVRDVIQRGFATHSVMLAPMTVKNIAITMMIAVQPMAWIVTIARFAILAPITCLSTWKHFCDHGNGLGWRLDRLGCLGFE
jgi:hypothetical protein